MNYCVLNELQIAIATIEEMDSIRGFYYRLIDDMESSRYKPGWKKDIYPSDSDLIGYIAQKELFVGRIDNEIIACMAFNHKHNPDYINARWKRSLLDSEFATIHMLGVSKSFSEKGIGKQMVYKAIDIAKESNLKAIRLDVLDGNLPAENLYKGIGFVYCDSIDMFYEDTGTTRFKLFEYLIR